MGVLEEHYKVTVDEKGSKYISLMLDWDYLNLEIFISMPGYVKKALQKFQHILQKIQNSPYPFTAPNYRVKTQYAEDEDKSPELNKEEIKIIQKVTGTFLYYAKAVDPTMLVDLSAIASQ